ncbi:MAG: hypothetical protein CMN21_00400, partial [Rubinisphaera sp.]|uniref:hypothetical protein n=2 Tax=Rubinisphaera TaxID=1649490 RepID=UPI000C0F7732
MLGIVTCFYNPCDYRRNRENYFRFRNAIGHPVTTVELSFNGQFIIPDAIPIEGNSQNVMWQKERLLNIGIESLPPKCDKVAWVDADLIFMNRHWVEQTEELLEKYQAVHLCERVHQTNLQGHITSSLETFGKGYVEKRLHEHWFHTGGAWAARREVLQPEGLFDQDIIGGADAFMAFAWSGDIERAVLHAKKTFSVQTQEYYRQQAELIHQQVQGQIGYVPGDTLHLWHGDKENRMYVTRLEFLKKYDFNPQSDIAVSESGLWKWNSSKPGMHRDVAEYFRLRQEDGPATTTQPAPKQGPQTEQAVEPIQRNENQILHKEQNNPIQKPTRLFNKKEKTMGCSACEEGLRQRKEQEKTEQRTRNVTKWSVGVTTAP